MASSGSLSSESARARSRKDTAPEGRGSTIGNVLRKAKWLGEFMVDYGSIALVVGLAALFLLGNRENPYGEHGPEGLIGIGFSVLAVKLWHDVREDRRTIP